MNPYFEAISTLEIRLKTAHRQSRALKSDEGYVKLREKYTAELRSQKREIVRLYGLRHAAKGFHV